MGIRFRSLSLFYLNLEQDWAEAPCGRWGFTMWVALLMLCLTVSSTAIAQSSTRRELIGRLVKGDDASRVPLAHVAVSLEPAGSSSVTDNDGVFRLFLPSNLQSGAEVKLSVVRMLRNLVIYQPPDGRITIPANLQSLKEIQLLPKGSLKFLSDAQLKVYVAQELAKRSFQKSALERADGNEALQEWAQQRGFTLEQVRAKLDDWAVREKSSKSATKYRLALAEFAEKNYQLASVHAQEAVAIVEAEQAALLQEQSLVTARLRGKTAELLKAYQLDGNANFLNSQFEKALIAYRKALQLLPKGQTDLQWIELQMQVGQAELNLSQRSEGVAVSTHFQSAEKAYLKALTVCTKSTTPQAWGALHTTLVILRQVAG